MENSSDSLVPIVGIGASAGGLEALELFFKHCPTDTGAAFVVIQHLSTDYKSVMDDLLARYTEMPVMMVSEHLTVTADTVYLIPAGTVIEVQGDQFRVFKRPDKVLTLPIDIFFQSVAKHYHELAVGVVLSGTGSDGTRGSLEINAGGGFIVSQSPETARFNGMPNSVIQAGAVDEVLPAEKIAARIVQHMRNPVPDEHRVSKSRSAKIHADLHDAYKNILDLLNIETGIDFHDYKPATVGRRIERRMQVKNILSIIDYHALLLREQAECHALRREILIPVTSFFRDPMPFDVLYRQCIVPLIKESNPHEGLRVWVAGCSTGEEAYSIAMLFLEAFEEVKKWLPLKIFATDVNEDNIELAGQGLYPKSIAAEVSPERLMRFFEQVDEDGYRVRQELRQTIVFARHNLVSDAPFTRMHLVSCRNALIYIQSKAQAHIMQKLRLATRMGGYFFLGNSEAIHDPQSEFSTEHGKAKIYQRIMPTNISEFGSHLRKSSGTRPSSRRSSGSNPHAATEVSLMDRAQSALLEHYAPPSILINQENEIIHVFGDMKHFLQIRPGTASFSLSHVLPEKLMPIVSAVMFRCKKNRQPAQAAATTLELAGEEMAVSVKAMPVAEQNEDWFLVSFDVVKVDEQSQISTVEIDNDHLERINQLVFELDATRESLQTTIEELEISNEELQSTNEELMASNEELQSSNEELQSVNEELNTVNAEYNEKLAILNRINADLDGISRATGIATLFLDQDLNLTRYTPDALKLFKLREQDYGRPIDEIVHNLDYPGIKNDFLNTIESKEGLEREVQSLKGEEILVRMLPYANSFSGTDGVVASFIDISGAKNSERLQTILDAMTDSLAVLDESGTIVMVNRAWEHFARSNGDPELLGTGIGTNYLNVSEDPMFPGEQGSNFVVNQLKKVLSGEQERFTHEYPCDSATEKRWFVMNAVAMSHPNYKAVVSHFDISKWRLAEAVESSYE